ncbi:hypothetical protein Q9L58_010491 [Maublancomyces gigas]|uniref:Endonuclease/exonuclease/phosphatase domain-containing protein n=1 Tax=Discina gigas TaxID=1032678 RepID=A0ABR3G3Y6_9PEZI
MIPRNLNPTPALDYRSHIHLTGKAKVQQLNCGKGKSLTIAAKNNIDMSTDILLTLRQEPWITDKGQPPHAINCDMLFPTETNAKFVTYIRKNLGFHSRISATYKECILSMTATIGNATSEFINVYAPNKKETQNFLEKHKPFADFFLAGDFNTQHPDWYGSLTRSLLDPDF